MTYAVTVIELPNDISAAIKRNGSNILFIGMPLLRVARSFWSKDSIGRIGVIGLEPRYLFLKICVVGRSVEVTFVIMEMIKDSNEAVNLSVVG